jgi:nucleotide-binding universal stress UspA family protein
MNVRTAAPIVVGVDGSQSSLDAVRLAVRMAGERRRPLRAVHAFIWPLMHVPLGPAAGAPAEGGLRHDAERVIATAVDLARLVDPNVEVVGAVVDGAASAVLLTEARDAALVVLGDRGLGGFTGLLVGSIAVQLAAHAACPVLVVRGAEQPDGPVVVGVDGSGHSELAVGFAFEEAAFRGVALHAIHAWTHPLAAEPGDMLPLVYDVGDVENEETRVLSEAVAGWCDRYPEVKVHTMVVRGRASRAIVEGSGRAQLLVVGARGRGGFAGLMLGSVSQAALHHARCPVAVVRHGSWAERPTVTGR